MKQANYWQTSDDILHKTKAEAMAHEAKISVRALLQDCGVCQGGEWSQDMIFRFLCENAEELAELLGEMK